jgi:hypothetical protein
LLKQLETTKSFRLACPPINLPMINFVLGEQLRKSIER